MLRVWSASAAALALMLSAMTGWAQPAISINDVTVTEGNSGQVNATFEVTLTAASTTPLTVSYTTQFSAVQGGGSPATQPLGTYGASCVGATDFLITSGTFILNAQIRRRSVTVPVCSNTWDEPDETFQVRFTYSQGGTIHAIDVNVTIVDDDGAATDNGPATGGAPALPTSTDLTLAVGRQVLDGPVQWVSELTLGTPSDIASPGLRFNWGRPASQVRIGGADPTSSVRGALSVQAQWQMIRSATPPQTVIFLGSSEIRAGGFLPASAWYKYGTVPVASPGSSAEFAIPATEFPARPPSGIFWVRVVLSTPAGLRASSWVKISLLGPGEPPRFRPE